MREEIHRENEKLVEQFRLENQKLNQEFSGRLQAETSKLSFQVRQLQSDTEKELTAVQGKLQGLSSEFDTRLEQQSRSNHEANGELTSKILEVKSEIDTISDKVNGLANDVETVKGDVVKCTEDLGKRQGESTARLKKGGETERSGNPMTCSTEVTQVNEVTDAAHSSPTPPPFANVDNVARSGNGSCSRNVDSCTVCVNGGVIGENASVPVRHHSANNYLSYTDLLLPQFDDGSEVNPIFHLNQLDEFIRLRCVPKPLQLALAFKSIVGAMGKQWVTNVARNLTDYDQFKVAFASTYRSRS
jgi:hypothetical protein